MLRLEGLAALMERLTTGREAMGIGLSQAVQECALQTAQAASERCPTDTGALKGSITASGAGLEAAVTASAGHAAAVELGTYAMEARPFLRPALANGAPAIRAAALEAIMSAFD